MRYELVCGYCGYQFVLDVDVLPHSVKCLICGTVLTLAVPVPVLPPAPPEPDPIPYPVPPPVPPRKSAPAPAADTRDVPPPRGAWSPWPVVRTWLKMALRATELGLGLLVFPFFILFCVFLNALERGRPDEAGVRFLLWVSGTLLVPSGVYHVTSQLAVGFATLSRGGALALTSVVFPPPLFALGLYAAVYSTVGAIILFVLGAVYGPLLWFTFLLRLGITLGEDGLVSAVRAYHVRFWCGLVLAASLLGLAYLTSHGASWPIGCVGCAGGGMVLWVLLWQYRALLHLATETLSRCAPMSHR